MTARAIIGTAGAGKTTRLMNEIDVHIDNGIGPGEILLVGLTHATVRAAREKGIVLDWNEERQRDDNIRTMDSICWNLHGEVMGVKDMRLFNPLVGRFDDDREDHASKQKADPVAEFNAEFGWKLAYNGDDSGMSTFEIMNLYETGAWQLYCLWRQKCIPREQWPTLAERAGLPFKAFDKFVADYETFIRLNPDVVDFTTIKERVLEWEIRLSRSYAIAYFDEVQDFNTLELRIIEQWGKDVAEHTYAGDPNQAIYETMRGAVGPAFADYVDRDRIHLLPRSYRCADRILEYGWQIAARASDFFDYAEYGAVEGRAPGGEVSGIPLSLDDPDEIAQLAADISDDGSTVAIVASFDGFAARLGSICRSLDALGVVYGNPYSDRADKRTWRSPIAHRRILRFMKPMMDGEPWTVADVRDWMGLIKVGGVFRNALQFRGESKAKNAAPSLPDNAIVTDELAAQIFENEPAMVLDWLAEHSTPASARIIDVARRVVERAGSSFPYESLRAEPLVNVTTIHGIKGGEADHVILFPDISALNARFGTRDERHRLFYVATTRARDRVHVGRPTRQAAARRHFYRLPE